MSWPTLTIRLKQRVVGLLDYESRCNLRLSSKDDRDAVDSTVFRPAKLKICEMQSDMSPGKTIIRCDMDTLTVWLIGKENLTRIDRGWNGEIVEELSETRQENRYEVLNRFLIFIANKGVIEAESVEIEAVDFAPPESWKPKCRSLSICGVTNQHIVPWISTSIANNAKFIVLEVSCWGEDEAIGTILNDVKVTHSLKLHHDVTMSDEQLETIEAADLLLSSQRITVDGAVKRLEHYLKFGRKEGCLELRVACPEGFDAEENFIPKSLKVKKETKENRDAGEFYGKIIGGFENVHGIQEPRVLEIIIFQDSMRIWSEIYEKPAPTPCQLYPF